jgi:hypothetical protein
MTESRRACDAAIAATKPEAPAPMIAIGLAVLAGLADIGFKSDDSPCIVADTGSSF